MADEASVAEVQERPTDTEQAQTKTPENRGGLWSRIGGLFGGVGERRGGNEDLKKGDVVKQFDLLIERLSRESDPVNQDISRQETEQAARNLLGLTAFSVLFPQTDSIFIAEGREIRAPWYKDGEAVEHKSTNLEKMREVIDAERERLGPKAKALV